MPAHALPPLPYSLGGNDIRAQGTSALAAVLKETQITNLKCVAVLEYSLLVRFCVSAH